METIGSYQAKTHLPALLERVTHGERITITKHGVPIAMLVPIEGPTNDERDEAIEFLLEFGKDRFLGMPFKDAIAEGRR